MTSTADSATDTPACNGTGAARSKSISWHDPAELGIAGKKLPGRDFLQAIVDGRLPPNGKAHGR
jgi:hypothetical protein